MSWRLEDTARSIPAAFAEQALRRPAHTAIDGTAWRPTYGELDAAANRLAHALLERGAGPRARVALLQAHDTPLVASALAVLKTGATLVILNASDPPARLERLRLDTAPTLILTDERHRPQALRAGFAPEAIVDAGHVRDCSPCPSPSGDDLAGPAVDPDALALLLCTSGSTGRPLAVEQTHRNVLHNVLRHTNGLGLREDDRIALLASPSGGQGAGTMWTALLGGATLCPFPVMDRGLAGLAEWLEETGVTVLIASASLFRHFVSTLEGSRLARVRLVRVGSEQAFSGDYESWRRHFSPGCRFANTYSSSETGAIAQLLMGAGEEPADGRLPAGRATEGTEILVLDEHGAELAPGQAGEIVVRSRHVSPGYWGERELTASRFTTEADGTRRFRTGDVGRRDEHGLLTVLARSDDVVKVRGNRVSLAEVETALNLLGRVAGAAVSASESSLGDTRLTAYVVPVPGSDAGAAGLRRELRTTLPDHAIPSELVLVERLPHGPHGKVDRAQLTQLACARPALGALDAGGESPEAPPAGEIEELIGALWARVLDRPSGVGREEDFFDLGGDSLSAAEVAVGVQRALGVEIGLRAFAAEPTVAALAQIALRMRAASASASASAGTDEAAIAPASARAAGQAHAPAPTTPAPASHAQERIWKLCATPEASAGYIVAAAMSLRGELDSRALRSSIERIVHRHEVLRTTFAERDGQLVQIVHPVAPVALALHDLSGAPEPAREAGALLERGASTAFDLERGPLLRFALVRLSPHEHQLQRINHHIVSDGWSWRVFVDELAALYEAHRSDGGSPLDELAIQYGDFALWQRRRTRPGSPRREALLAWWRELAATSEATAPPFARARVLEDASPIEARIRWGLPSPVTEGLARLGREAGATYYMVRLAAFAALLAAESGERELLLGTYTTTRGQPETRMLFGCFTHLAALRLSSDGEPTVAQWLSRVRAAVLDAGEHADLPYESAAEELAREGVALPGVLVLFAPMEAHQSKRFAGIELGPAEQSLEHYMPSGFSFLVDRDHEQDGCRTDFDARIYDPARVRAFVERYRTLAGKLCGSADRPLGELVARSAGCA